MPRVRPEDDIAQWTTKGRLAFQDGTYSPYFDTVAGLHAYAPGCGRRLGWILIKSYARSLGVEVIALDPELDQPAPIPVRHSQYAVQSADL